MTFDWKQLLYSTVVIGFEILVFQNSTCSFRITSVTNNSKRVVIRNGYYT